VGDAVTLEGVSVNFVRRDRGDRLICAYADAFVVRSRVLDLHIRELPSFLACLAEDFRAELAEALRTGPCPAS
jgi:hypothetical protein